MTVIDLRERKHSPPPSISQTAPPAPRRIRPDGLALRHRRALRNAVDVIDPSTRKSPRRNSRRAAIPHAGSFNDGRRGYTANVGAESVSVLDWPSAVSSTTIPVTKDRPAHFQFRPMGFRVFTHDQGRARVRRHQDTATNKNHKLECIAGLA